MAQHKSLRLSGLAASLVALGGLASLVTLWLAWQGRMFAKVELPIGSVETRDAGALDDAADEFAEFKGATIERLDTVEDAIAELTPPQPRRIEHPGEAPPLP